MSKRGALEGEALNRQALGVSKRGALTGAAIERPENETASPSILKKQVGFINFTARKRALTQLNLQVSGILLRF